jgi:hypothetical protein
MDSWIEANATGPTGNTGYTGSFGNIGYTGSRGIGYTGSKGDIGYTGSSGYAGSQGIIGYTGSKGFTGSKGLGYTGSQGDIGYKGYTGSQGPFGDVTINSTPPTSGNLWWDPIGGNLYIKYGSQWIAAITINPNIAYTPSVPGNWTSPVHNLFQALDQIAARLHTLEQP